MGTRRAPPLMSRLRKLGRRFARVPYAFLVLLLVGACAGAVIVFFDW